MWSFDGAHDLWGKLAGADGFTAWQQSRTSSLSGDGWPPCPWLSACLRWALSLAVMPAAIHLAAAASIVHVRGNHSSEAGVLCCLLVHLSAGLVACLALLAPGPPTCRSKRTPLISDAGALFCCSPCCQSLQLCLAGTYEQNQAAGHQSLPPAQQQHPTCTAPHATATVDSSTGLSHNTGSSPIVAARPPSLYCLTSRLCQLLIPPCP